MAPGFACTYFRLIILASSDITYSLTAIGEWLLYSDENANNNCSSTFNFCLSCGRCADCNCPNALCSNFSGPVSAVTSLSKQICGTKNIQNVTALQLIVPSAIFTLCPTKSDSFKISSTRRCALSMLDYFDSAISSSTYDQATYVQYLFDGDLETVWISRYDGYHSYADFSNNIGYYSGFSTTTVDGVTYAGEWVQIKLVEKKQLSHFVLFPVFRYTFTSEGYLMATPNSFVIACSNDSITWTFIDRRDNLLKWTLNGFQFQIPLKYNTLYCLYFRLIILSTNDVIYAQALLSEWLLYPLESRSVGDINDNTCFSSPLKYICLPVLHF